MPELELEGKLSFTRTCPQSARQNGGDVDYRAVGRVYGPSKGAAGVRMVRLREKMVNSGVAELLPEDCMDHSGADLMDADRGAGEVMRGNIPVTASGKAKRKAKLAKGSMDKRKLVKEDQINGEGHGDRGEDATEKLDAGEVGDDIIAEIKLETARTEE